MGLRGHPQLTAQLAHAVDHFLTQFGTVLNDVQRDFFGGSVRVAARHTRAKIEDAVNVDLAKLLDAVCRDADCLLLGCHTLPTFSGGYSMDVGASLCRSLDSMPETPRAGSRVVMQREAVLIQFGSSNQRRSTESCFRVGSTSHMLRGPRRGCALLRSESCVRSSEPVA